MAPERTWLGSGFTSKENVLFVERQNSKGRMTIKEQHPDRFRDFEHFQNFMDGKEGAILPFVERDGKMYANPDYLNAPCESKVIFHPRTMQINESSN
jgi:hypothetical protein